MIEVLNYDGHRVDIMVSRITHIIHTGRGQSCTIMLDDDKAVFCTESGKIVAQRVSKYLNDNRLPPVIEIKEW